MYKDPTFTIGVEEEYLLVATETRDCVDEVPPAMLEALSEHIGEIGLVGPEFLRSQVEVGTKVCATVAEVRAELSTLRRGVADVASRFGMAPIAASTHPFAQWSRQKHTARERYDDLAQAFQGVAQRLLICGTHVHVGIEDEQLRIDLMNQAAYFLPHLLALSTSSPFWAGRKTGLMSYRLAVFDELPRTGLPEVFDSWLEYDRHVQVLVSAGLIDDASKIWWDIRPSARFPTIEMRITDMCTRLDDTLTIAALYVCILRMLWRLRKSNQRWRLYARMLIAENRWRAQRYGLDDGMVDFGKGQIVGFPELMEELLYLLRDDIAYFGVEAEMQNLRHILDRGTSAHRQIHVYEEALGFNGGDEQGALKAVVDDLIIQTVRGL